MNQGSGFGGPEAGYVVWDLDGYNHGEGGGATKTSARRTEYDMFFWLRLKGLIL